MKDFSEKIIQGLKDVQKEIVVEIDRICRENGLRYYLAYGTLLGAIRHNGFIPWDDDIDVMMPYDDMIKFAQVFEEKGDKSRFFYQSPETDEEYGLVISRLCRNDTFLLEETFKDRNIHHGIFVDIYPLFGVEEGYFSRKMQIFRAMKRALYVYDEAPKHKGSLMTIGSKIMLGLKTKAGKKRAAKKLTEKLAKKSFDESEKVADLSSGLNSMCRAFEKKWFGEGKEHVFEDLKLLIPENFHEILSSIYGDYMQLPPVEKRQFHHNYSLVRLLDGTEESI